MERAISEMEKIRRAEEIYSRRKNLKNETINKEPKGIYKPLFQTLLLINIVIVVVAIQNKNYIFTKDFMSQMNSYNVNIKSTIESWFTNKEKNNEIIENQINQNTQTTEQNVENASVDSQNNGISGESNEVQGALVENQEENFLQIEDEFQIGCEEKQLSQMEIDSLEIKQKYSIILPINGTKTSGFGDRVSTNKKVTGYHTGVDIAANSGTVIYSSTTGTVTQVSSVGDYGKHLRITTDNLTVLYAHCSKIYVHEGDEIIQGQPIAEVGSTGNSTGPHLHFELRYENRYVNPELILDI